MDEELLRVLKLVGWGWAGKKLGLPITQILQSVRQREHELMQENRRLKAQVFQAALDAFAAQCADLRLRNELRQKEVIIWELRNQHAELQRRIGQQNARNHRGLEARGRSTQELASATVTSQQQWLRVLPAFPRCVILGAPGTGKSATAHFLLELCRSRAEPYILGFPEGEEDLLPKWMGLAASFDEVPGRSTVLIDEAYLRYHARMSGFSRGVQEMSQALGLARQRGHSILFVAHEGRHLDKNIIAYANMFVIKEPGPMDTSFERSELRAVVERAKEFFEGKQADRRRWAYVSSPELRFEGPLETPLPSYWTEELSRVYAGGALSPAERYPHTTKEEKKARARIWREREGLSYGQIADRLCV